MVGDGSMKQKLTGMSRRYVTALQSRLEQRTSELSVAKRRLKQGAARRKTVEKSLKKSGIRQRSLLKDSLLLQQALRQLTHQVLIAQEEERKKISVQLRDEVAQTLLGVSVRLLSLKQEARSNTKGLKNEIASMQRLTLKSAQSVRRVARDFGHG